MASSQSLQSSAREEHIEVICHSKYLGVQIEQNLEKASRAIGFLKYAKHFLPESIVKDLCTSIFEPTSNTAALLGSVAIPLTSYNCRGSKTEQHAS